MSVFEINGQGLCGKNEDDLINKWALLQLSAFFFFAYWHFPFGHCLFGQHSLIAEGRACNCANPDAAAKWKNTSGK